ncbi:type II toxin-antitoxin system Phd/YefM family antitoxin, partial [Brevundimonas sp.]
MAAYSVAEAKNTLPRLLDKAIEGEKVIITRHGKPVAEIRSLPTTNWDERRARMV